MRRILHLLTLAVGVLCVLPAALAEDGKPATEYQLKAVYLYKITPFVQWPGEKSPAKSHIINVCVLGDNPFGGNLNILKQASSAQLAFNIKRNIADGDIPNCHIVFISKSETSRVSSLIEEVQKYPVLTVSDIEGFAAGGGIIEMVKDENNVGAVKIRLIINAQSAEAVHLRIDAQLLEIAAKVIK